MDIKQGSARFVARDPVTGKVEHMCEAIVHPTHTFPPLEGVPGLAEDASRCNQCRRVFKTETLRGDLCASCYERAVAAGIRGTGL